MSRLVNSIGLRHEVIAAALGVSVQTVRAWSSGKRAVNGKRARQLVDLKEAVRQVVAERRARADAARAR